MRLHQFRTNRFAFALLIALSCGPSAALEAADPWGDLRGRFVYDGPPPQAQAIPVGGRGQNVALIQAEDLVVSAEGGLQNIVMYLHTTRGEPEPPIFPGLGPRRVLMAQANQRFEPHVAAVQIGDQLTLWNREAFATNPHIGTLNPNNPLVNMLLPARRFTTLKFSAAETLPITVVDNILPWSKAYLVIKDHPYVAITDAAGAFELKNVPAGKWRFKCWHEKAGYVTKVERDGMPLEWRRGELEVQIKAGETTDLGTLKVKPELFER